MQEVYNLFIGIFALALIIIIPLLIGFITNPDAEDENPFFVWLAGCILICFSVLLVKGLMYTGKYILNLL
jgi:hypothetical protein